MSGALFIGLACLTVQVALDILDLGRVYLGDLLEHEYHEGPEANEKFVKLATQLFRAPKSTAKPSAKPARKSKANSKMK